MIELKKKFEVKRVEKMWRGEKTHEYWYGRTKLVGVTTTLGYIVSPGLKNWFIYKAAAEIKAKKEKGCEVGTLVHKVAEEVTQGKAIDIQVPDMYRAEFENGKNAFVKWWQESDIVPVANELAIASREHGFAGTLDLLGCRKERLVLVDFKTSTGIFESNYLQLGGYILGLRELYGLEVDEKEIIRFDKNTGLPEVKPITLSNDYLVDLFLSNLKCYKFFRILQAEYDEKVKKAKEGEKESVEL